MRLCTWNLVTLLRRFFLAGPRTWEGGVEAGRCSGVGLHHQIRPTFVCGAGDRVCSMERWATDPVDGYNHTTSSRRPSFEPLLDQTFRPEI